MTRKELKWLRSKMLSDKITNWKNKIVRKIEDKAEHGQDNLLRIIYQIH